MSFTESKESITSELVREEKHEMTSRQGKCNACRNCGIFVAALFNGPL